MEKKIKTFKAIRQEIEALAPVKNKEAFLAALPKLVELSTKLERTRSTTRTMGKVLDELNAAVSKYAIEHQSVFMSGQLNVDGKGVEHGDVDVDGTVYHFSHGYEGYRRPDGSSMTRDFLTSLPAGWTKTKPELDVTAINKANPTVKELAKAGLESKPKDKWSLGDDDSVESAE